MLSPQPIFILGSREDQIKRLSVSRLDSCAVNGAVQKYHSKQMGLLLWIPRKVQRIGLVREF